MIMLSVAQPPCRKNAVGPHLTLTYDGGHLVNTSERKL